MNLIPGAVCEIRTAFSINSWNPSEDKPRSGYKPSADLVAIKKRGDEMEYDALINEINREVWE